MTRTLDGDEDGAREVLTCFLGSVPTYWAAIEGASDVQSLRRALHTLKGSLLALGAFELASYVASCEEEVQKAQVLRQETRADLRARLDHAVCEAASSVQTASG
ncbi:MAG: Hpt domain-containing protein [Myxococcales bacterium]|nr:Hpt domain-containing protein [Myxococcales bacterium]